MEAEAERERLLVGIIELTAKIIVKVDKSVSEKIVAEKDLVNEIFKEFLFASVFSKAEGEKEAATIAVRARSRKHKPKSSSGGESEARVAAYALLNGLIKKSPELMLKFIQGQLMPLMDRIKKPKGWKWAPTSAGGDSL
jgi:hypothetical protein